MNQITGICKSTYCVASFKCNSNSPSLQSSQSSRRCVMLKDALLSSNFNRSEWETLGHAGEPFSAGLPSIKERKHALNMEAHADLRLQLLSKANLSTRVSLWLRVFDNFCSALATDLRRLSRLSSIYYHNVSIFFQLCVWQLSLHFLYRHRSGWFYDIT